ncbi:hypothetical protein C5E11_02925 [Clavibacter michiganensis]|nr:hypothetical protein [Clavibacter michiganensis]PPF65028.1 hypothetical protein C5E11_02925 [Clavibacter michiganensis]
MGVLSSSAGAPVVLCFAGSADPVVSAAASAAGRVEVDIPSNRSPYFAPVIEPTLRGGIDALIVAARTCLESLAG